MKKTEIITAFLSLIAIVLNLCLTEAGRILTIITFIFLAGIYFHFGFALFNGIRLRKIFKKESYQGISPLRIIGAIGAGIAFSIVLIGIMFKIEYLPGADFEIKAGLAFLAPVFIIGLFRLIQTKADYYKRIMIRAVIIGSIGLFFAFIPETSWIKFKYRNHPEYLEALNDAFADPDNRELWDKVEEEREKF